jgi:hypothetical protein
MADIANDRLSARVYMHMLDPDLLFALAPFPRQGFDLHGVGAHEFDCQIAEHIQPLMPSPSYLWPATAPRVRATNSNRCDMIVATVVLPHDRPATIEPSVMEFLNSRAVLHWAGLALGI